VLAALAIVFGAIAVLLAASGPQQPPQ